MGLPAIRSGGEFAWEISSRWRRAQEKGEVEDNQIEYGSVRRRRSAFRTDPGRVGMNQTTAAAEMTIRFQPPRSLKSFWDRRDVCVLRAGNEARINVPG